MNNKIEILEQFQYFITKNTEPCSYLDGQESRIVLIDPDADIDSENFSALAYGGFRRSGNLIYKPKCNACAQCIACRIAVNDFIINSMQKKAWKRNQDLTITIIPAQDATDQHAELYIRYLNSRHADRQIDEPSTQQFYDYLVKSRTDNIFIEFKLDGQLIAVSACDIFSDGLSAVYTFFEPEHHRRSLGVFAILMQIEYAKSLNLDYVYLGYWIPHSKKMNYKAQYQPLEILYQHQWHRIAYPLNPEHIESFSKMLNAEPLFHVPAILLPIFNPQIKFDNIAPLAHNQ